MSGNVNLNTLNCCYLVDSLHITSGCTNPDNLATTALIDTGANISLLQQGAPAIKAPTQEPTKSVTQPKGNLLTTETLLLLLNKLPSSTRISHHAPGITNNLLAVSNLVDAGCEIFFIVRAVKSRTMEKSSSEGGGTLPLTCGGYHSTPEVATTSYQTPN